jgi:SET domain-containing protein
VEKFPLGPIIDPSPGPTFDIEVAAPEIEVIKSSPVNDNNAAIIKKIKKYMYIKEIIEATNLLSTGFWLYFNTKIPLG